jgi:Tfp pilus assembly PilM family ATPase
LAKHDEISSTEKLLDLIRNNHTSPDNNSNTLEPPQSRKLRKSISTKIIPFKRSITVGVDIGHYDLKMVKVTQYSDKQWKLMDYMKIPFKSPITKESSEFSDLLKSTLTKFCGRSKRIKIWALMSSAHAEIHHLRIPKVGTKKISNAVYWTLKKETSFKENDTIFDFEVHGDVMEKGIPKLAVVACVTPKKEVEKLKSLFSKTGFRLTGLSTAEFAYQNLFRTKWISTAEKTIACLYIGEERSRIDIFASGNLAFTRGIKFGMNSMIESFLEGFKEREKGKILRDIDMPERKNISSPKGFDKESALSIDDARKIILNLNPDQPPLIEKNAGFQIKEEEIYEIIIPAVERLIRQIERTFEHYIVTLENNKIDKMFISGETIYRPLIDYISDQLGLAVDIIDSLAPEIPFLDGISSPTSVSERVSFAPTVGIALSDNSHTPNLTFTYKDKEKLVSIRHINRGIFAAFILIIAVFMGIFLWQEHMKELKKAKIFQLQKEISGYIPKVDQETLMLMASKYKRKQKDLKEYSMKYLGMAIIKDLTMITPSNIRLLSITGNFGSIIENKAKDTPKILEVDGIILGNRDLFDSSLAGYLIKLKDSPLFNQLSIIKNEVEVYEEREALHFILNIQLV